ncbi:MAG: cell division protein FtsZ [Treponema sp.]|jgi:cell division protein FtsZ|nr:cell division protein FtsZ [Treponema sp.]
MNNLIINRNEQERFQESSPVVIKVIGTGGGGSNGVNAMIEYGLRGVEFIVINTDVQDLKKSRAPKKIQIGSKYTGGRGAGGKPDIGEKAANEDIDQIDEAVKGSNMVFLTAGLGGGTGTGSAPIIAQEAKKCGALVVGVVTKPFDFEGAYRMRLAEEGIEKLKEIVDTLIVIPNQQLLSVVDRRTPIKEAFLKVDDILRQGVQGISDIINETGLINIDFADAETVMRGQGYAIMGIGYGSGDNRTSEAATAAMDNPLLEGISFEGASRILINVSGGDDFSLVELHEVVSLITANAAPDAIIISGASIDSNLQDQLRVTVVATGFENEAASRAQKKAPVIETAKSKENDVIDITEFEKMRNRTTRRPDYLPQRNTAFQEEDLDVPTLIRDQKFMMNKNPSFEKQHKQGTPDRNPSGRTGTDNREF